MEALLRALKLSVFALLFFTRAFAQTYPSPIFQSITVRDLTSGSLIIGGGTGGAVAATTTGAGVLTALGLVPNTNGAMALVNGSPSAGNCLKWSASGIESTVGVCGTVTSVAQSFTGGLISVSGSPVTTTGTLALTVAGTSGGIPYFSSSSTWASSGALTANLPVIGGGAGAAPTVGTRSGNTTKFATSTGTLTNGDCVSIDANGNYIDAGGPCGIGGGGGTVTASANADRLPYYAAAGNTVVESTIVASRVVSGVSPSVVLDIPTWSNTGATALDDKGTNKAPALKTSAAASYYDGYLFRLPRMYSTVTPGNTHDHIFGEPSATVEPSNHSFVGCILCEFYESAAGTTAFVGTDGTTTPVLGTAAAGIAAHAHMTAFGPSVNCAGSEALCMGHIATATSPNDIVIGRAKDTGGGTGANVLIGGVAMTITGTGGTNIGIGTSGTFTTTGSEDILLGATNCTIGGAISNAIGIGRNACPSASGSIVIGGQFATKLYAGSESAVVPVYTSGVVSQGTAPSTNFGTCTIGTWTGGPWVGQFLSSGACATGGTYYWNTTKTPPYRLACSAYDYTNSGVTIVPTSSTFGAAIQLKVTSATSVANNDVIVVNCQGY